MYEVNGGHTHPPTLSLHGLVGFHHICGAFSINAAGCTKVPVAPRLSSVDCHLIEDEASQKTSRRWEVLYVSNVTQRSGPG